MLRSGIKRKNKSGGKSEFQKLVTRADNVFSKYIRLRDAIETPYGLYFKCISCGRIKRIDQADCGHYINRQHMVTRYSEMNCNAQCRECNRFDEGNMSGYRRGLVEKYGEGKVEVLESLKNQSKKYVIFELKALMEHFKKEIQRLEKEKGKLNAP